MIQIRKKFMQENLKMEARCYTFADVGSGGCIVGVVILVEQVYQ